MKTTDTTTNEAIARDRDNVTLRKDFIRCWVHANPAAGEDRASRLYDALQARFPDLTRGGHRGLVGRLQPWETVVHECPCCGKEAQGLQDIKEGFGLRLVGYNTKEGRKEKLYFQSWCRDCRREERKGGSGVRINPEVEQGFTNRSDAPQ
jgi:hypothetical protein